MWVITTRGFFSVVENRNDKSRVLVRARNKNDIKNLAKLIPGSKPYDHKSADYEWRIDCSREEWNKAMLALSDDIDYPNFKSAVARKQGHKRSAIYSRVWGTLLDLERDGRPSKWWSKGGSSTSTTKKGKKSKGKNREAGTQSAFGVVESDFREVNGELYECDCPAGMDDDSFEAHSLGCPLGDALWDVADDNPNNADADDEIDDDDTKAVSYGKISGKTYKCDCPAGVGDKAHRNHRVGCEFGDQLWNTAVRGQTA